MRFTTISGQRSRMIHSLTTYLFSNGQKKQGCVVGVVSNGTERYRKEILPQFGLDEFIDFQIYSQELGFEKPEKEIYEEALMLGARGSGLTQLPPPCWLHIGDKKELDYDPIISLGAHACLIDRFRKAKQEGKEEGGPMTFTDLRQAQHWIESSFLLPNISDSNHYAHPFIPPMDD